MAESLSVFFPCYNEQDNLLPLVEEAHEVCRQLTDDFEIILVNDGSTDRTADLMEQLARQYPRLRTIHHPSNKGYGAALISGFSAAQKQIVFFSDADRQFRLAEMKRFWALIDRYDAVVGYRKKRRDPFHRRLFGKGWTMLNQFLLGVRIRDMDCAFKMFHSYQIKELNLKSQSAMISPELICKLTRRRCRFKQLGVEHYPRQAGTQTCGQWRTIISSFRDLLKLRRELMQEPLGRPAHWPPPPHRRKANKQGKEHQ